MGGLKPRGTNLEGAPSFSGMIPMDKAGAGAAGFLPCQHFPLA